MAKLTIMISALHAARSHLLACVALALAYGCADADAPDRPVERGGGGSSCWTTLGTAGGPLPLRERGQPANLLTHESANYFVDIGDGAFSALARAEVSPRAINGVFISHLHFDHTGGLAALLGLRHALRIEAPLTIYGPPGTAELVAGIVASMRPAVEAGYGVSGEPTAAAADAQLSVVELRGDGAPFQVGDLRVRAVENTHYSFAAGSPEAERFKSLSYRFDAPTWSVAYTGDTGPSPIVEDLAHRVDLLVSEMIDYDETVASIGRNAPGLSPASLQSTARHLAAHHLTAEQVANFAARAQVSRLVVTHLVPGNQSAELLSQYRAAIAQTYTGPISIAADGDRYCATA